MSRFIIDQFLKDNLEQADFQGKIDADYETIGIDYDHNGVYIYAFLEYVDLQNLADVGVMVNEETVNLTPAQKKIILDKLLTHKK
jgi:hypothetical protein